MPLHLLFHSTQVPIESLKAICMLQVYREFKHITEYRISDGCCLGEPNVEIIYADAEPTESFELASLSYLNKGIDLRNLSGCCGEFDKITRNLRDRVCKASSELHEINVQIQKDFHEYQTQCQTIDENVSFSHYYFNMRRRSGEKKP